MKGVRLLKITLAVALLAVIFSACVKPEKKPGQVVGGEPTITLYVNETGEKKKIKLEEYLAGVVVAEMEPTWPQNALAAQAILARTFTMENIESGRVKKIHGTDVSTDVEESQAYDPSRINERVKKAINDTRGQVIKYKGRYVKGWFSACCGGVTAGAEEGLDWKKTKTPYIKAGLKDGCMEITNDENRDWWVQFPISTVRQAVKNKTGQDPGDITGVEIVKRGPSGRAEEIKLGRITISGPALRLALGSEKMRSTLIKEIKVKGDNLVINGNGFGHGVGLCQWGAYKMAQEGKSPEEIIKFYYQNVTIDKLWK
ncbi:stage II sporulation protein D [Desulfohalotomaculum tongense]|uniref:SpoIID/LytB domain-containing protein n=1 Tax=Desulforadius tongensis TaxID=1216062 RepID=UPI00195E08B6|nr:SpoIID/LytB domain-containing protein [Desulforadius tongensis]MBM7855977.1 stage II sporulation protein D [Desulforadius tongensis]